MVGVLCIYLEDAIMYTSFMFGRRAEGGIGIDCHPCGKPCIYAGYVHKLKDPQRSEYFSNLSMPSYMRDWLVMKFSDDDGIVDYDSIHKYIKRFIPGKDDFEQYKFQMVNGNTVQFLARVQKTVLFTPFTAVCRKKGEPD